MRTGFRRVATLVAIACAAINGATAVAHAAATAARHAADSPAPRTRPSAPAKKAPSNPPLTSGAAEAGTSAEEESPDAGTSSAGDPLISNGLGSPMCRAGSREDDLSQASERNCQTSGFEAAPAPTGNYAFDVHINTAVTKWKNDAAATIQNLLQLAWTALVTAVHGVIVMIEWCYTLDLLDSSAMSGVARGLRATQTAFTQPWLVTALAVASVLAAYHGLVRRRVAETIGQALMMLAMMAGGLWVIMDPTGTVGSLGQWANQAGVGVLGTVAGGTPDSPDRTLADSMGDVFSGAIGDPWCFLEFGNVRWCRDPALMDPRLRAAALAIAGLERAQVGCRVSSGALGACSQPGSESARALGQSVEQLQHARTNGGLFLALPANQLMRNSINDPRSLFNVLCGGSETPCTGATAAQAEFRTEHGTEWRFIGVVFIWAGALGMLLLLGFIAMHLLGAAIASLLYLLVAPAAVLAPALGDGGRAAFRAWAARLLGAVMSKLIYSFLLGVMLLMQRILTVDLTALGWFTQWLLISAMWWGVFSRRHQVLGFAHGEGARPAPQSLARRVSGALETPRGALRAAGAVKRGLSAATGRDKNRHERADARREHAEAPRKHAEAPREHADTARERAEIARGRARDGAEEQAGRMLDSEHRDAVAQAQAEAERQAQLSARRAQLERVAGERGKALASGDERRAAELAHRAQRIEEEVGRSQRDLNAARLLAGEGERARSRTGRVYTSAQAEERERFLDAQAALPASVRAGGARAGERRDYAGLAGLAGYGRSEYELLDSRGRRAARLDVDRELALRKELSATAANLAADSVPSALGRREKRHASKDFDSKLKERMRDGGHAMPSSRRELRALEFWRNAGTAARGSDGRSESSVMRDAREVAARRKRQLGRDQSR